MNAVVPVAYRTEGPQPLLRKIPRGAAYPVEALGPLKRSVEAAQAITQAPIAIAAQSALSVASLAVQGHADVETLGGFAPTSLYCLTIARSGERKSATDKVLMDGLRQYERDRAGIYASDLEIWKNEQALWKGKRESILAAAKKPKAPKSRIETQADLEALGPEPKAPISPNITVSEPTLEGLHLLYATGQPALGLFSDEGGQFLGGHAMNSDNRMKTVAGLSGLWGGEPINRTRSGDGASTLYGRRLTTHLMVQPIAARPLLADPIASGQGFLARFLITEPPSAIGTRLANNISVCGKVADVAATSRLLEILEADKPTAENNPQELEPRQLLLTGGARDLLRQYYNAAEQAQAPGGEFEHVTSFASKSAEQAARIAAVLTLWEDLGASMVTPETMANGIMLAQFYLGEAKRLAEAATISIEVERAERLRVWLLESWPSKAASIRRSADTIVPRDIVQHGPGSLRETKEAKKCLSILEDAGWVVPLPERTKVGGMTRKEAFQIVRSE